MADRYWVGGGSSTAWTATGNTNWSASSGGANNASVPTSADIVYFDGVGVNANGTSAIISNQAALKLIMTSGFTGTLNQSGAINLNVNGDTVTLGANCTISAAGTLTSSGACTFTFNGKSWNTIVLSSASTTRTLADDVRCSSLSISTTGIVINGNNLYFSTLVTPQLFTGTTTLIQQGSGTWSGSGTVGLNMTITGTFTLTSASAFQTRSLTVTGTFNLGAQTLTLTSMTFVCSTGTINAGTSTISATTCTFNLNGEPLNIVNFSGTITINSSLVFDQTNSSATPIVFAGTSGWTCDVLNGSAYVAAATWTFQESVEYIITSNFSCSASRIGATVLFQSSSASNKAKLTLNDGALCSVLASFTRIDAGNGRTIRTFKGVVTDCINIQSFEDIKPVAATF